MPRQPLATIGRDELELPCVWAPDRKNEAALPTLSHEVSQSLGHASLAIRAIFQLSGYGGPGPGFPWVEFGRMTLTTEATGDRTALADNLSRGVAGSAGTDIDPRAATILPEALADGETIPPAAPKAGGAYHVTHPATPITGATSTDLGDAITAVNSLHDLRIMLAASEALSPSNPIIASLAAGVSPAGSVSTTMGRTQVDASIQQEPLPPLPPVAPPLPPQP